MSLRIEYGDRERVFTLPKIPGILDSRQETHHKKRARQETPPTLKTKTRFLETLNLGFLSGKGFGKTRRVWRAFWSISRYQFYFFFLSFFLHYNMNFFFCRALYPTPEEGSLGGTRRGRGRGKGRGELLLLAVCLMILGLLLLCLFCYSLFRGISAWDPCLNRYTWDNFRTSWRIATNRNTPTPT